MSDVVQAMVARWRAWIKETDETVAMHDKGIIKFDDDATETMRAAADRLRNLADQVEKKRNAQRT